MALQTGTRQQRNHAKALERRAWKTGNWGEWRMIPLPHGIPGHGWRREIRLAHANDLYAVMERPVETRWGTVRHLAIRTASNLEPPWRDKQRIKDELFGQDAVAVEVMPPAGELIDEADMYHMWVLPEGFEMPFTLARRPALVEAA
ncbi:MAG: hypothetical protein RL268_188 [Pseudomonadota bacterium]|jgi:hypothetical protein